MVCGVERQHLVSGTNEPVLDARAITCTAADGSGTRNLFEGVSMQLRASEIVDLRGESGAGKSSLLTALAQLNPRAHATLQLHGKDSVQYSVQEWRRSVAYVPQTSTLIGGNVAEVIRAPWLLRVRRNRHENPPQDHALREALERVGCADIELSRPASALSGGQSARVSLLRALLTKPDVLLADEVDAGLDDDNAARVSQMLVEAAAQGMAICRIRHRSPDGLATRTLMLAGGRLQ